MYSGPSGIPHKEVKQLPVKTKRHDSEDNLWMELFQGQGLISDVYIQPKDWWTTDQVILTGVEPTVVIEFDEPTNLTHIHMKTDTTFTEIFGIASDQGAFYCDYSHDGVAWSRLAYPCIGNGYYTGSGSFDNVDAYFWIPRTKIKAKFWRLVVLDGAFGSSYGDGTWHISELNPGTLDNIKDDILLDASELWGGIDPAAMWPPESLLMEWDDILPWVGAGKVHRTSMQLDIMFMLRSEDSSSSLINTKYFWMDRHSVKQMLLRYGKDSSYNMAVPIILHNGFISNIATHYNDVWDAAHRFVTITLNSEKYFAFGWANSLQKGVSCTRAFQADKRTIPNNLGVTPDCVWLLYGGTQQALTHPLHPTTLYPCFKSSGTTEIVTLNATLLEFGFEYGELASGVVLFKEANNFFQGGQYTGNGVADRFITTPNINPKIVIVKRIPNGDAGTYMIISALGSDDTWELSGFNTTLLFNEGIVVAAGGFTVKVIDEVMNASGEEYLWWAWE